MKLSINQAVERTIRYAEFLRLKSIAFPVLGDPELAPPYEFIAKEMVQDAVKYFQKKKTKIKVIFYSAYNDKAYNALTKEARQFTE